MYISGLKCPSASDSILPSHRAATEAKIGATMTGGDRWRGTCHRRAEAKRDGGTPKDRKSLRNSYIYITH